LKRQEKRRRKIKKQKKEARMILLVTAKLLGVHPSKVAPNAIPEYPDYLFYRTLLPEHFI
jgi:hypothetical protein